MDHRITSRHPRIRTRSLRGSSLDEYLEGITKIRRNNRKNPPRERVLTRRLSRLSGDHNSIKLSTLELPLVKRRRRCFSKQKSDKSNSCQAESVTENNSLGNTLITKSSESIKSQNAQCESSNAGPKRTSRKLNDIFYKKPPGKHRRRRRQPALPIRRTVSDYEGALSVEPPSNVSNSSSVEDGRADVRSHPHSCSMIKDDSVASIDNVVNHERDSEICVSECQSEVHKDGLPAEDSVAKSGSEDEFSIVRNETSTSDYTCGDKNLSFDEPDGINSNDDTNEGTDSDAHPKNQFLIDENSCSAVASNDGDSRDSTEYEASLKYRCASVNTVDSDAGSYSSTENSGKRQRCKTDQSHLHRPGIDFRVGGRLEARDYLNMWYPSRVIQVDWEDKEVLIHFERWNSRFDEWVPMDSSRLRAITRTSARKEKKDCTFPVPKNFKNITPLKLDEKARRASGSKLEENSKPKTQAKKVSPERAKNASFRSKERSSNSGQKNSIVALGNKRRKLVVGGIFQAKKRNSTFVSNNCSCNSSPTDSLGKTKNEIIMPQVKSLQRTSIDSPDSSTDKAMEVAVVNQKEIDTPIQPCTASNETCKGNVSPADVDCDVPRKQFVIEEDHNHFKCLVDGCGKAFRKDILLASHMKHYHRNLTTNPSPCTNSIEEVKEADDKRQQAEIGSSFEMPKEELVQPIKKEGNLERKLITEKRRQLLFQRKLERRHQQAAMALQARNALKKPQVVLENHVEDTDQFLQSDKPKSNPKKRKLLLTSKGMVSKMKKRKLEDDNSVMPSQAQESNGECKDIQSSPVESILPSEIEPANIKTVIKGKRRRRFEHVTSSDGSEKSTNTSVSDGIDNDRHVKARHGKGFGRCGTGRNIKKPCYEWGDGEREEVVNCRCLQQEEDGLMMQCEVCLAWQHGTCFDIEEEDKVPEKYVCFACENPKGMRRSFKYRHNQDWFKLGELATFRFIPKRENPRLKDNTVRSHNLASQILSIEHVLHSLQCKLQIAKEPKHPNLVLWSHSWIDDSDSRTATIKACDKVGPEVLCDQQPGHLGEWAFNDHSYSAPNRIYESEFVAHSNAFLSEHCDDKHLCMEVAANEVLDVQGSGPPAQDGMLEFGLANIKHGDSTENSEMNGIAELASDDSVSRAVNGSRTSEGSKASPKKEMCSFSHKSIPNVKDETCNSRVVRRNSDSKTDKMERSLNYMKMPKVKSKSNLKCNNLETKIPEEIDKFSCQLNLLNHIEQLQEELDRRLDDLTLQLESLETEYESLALSNSDDGISDIPQAKRLLKAMTNDLLKVQRMALYC